MKAVHLGYFSHQVKKALKAGILKKPNLCEKCGVLDTPGENKRSKLSAHHADYNYPLKVEWLCKKCHVDWHKNNKPIRSSSVYSQETLFNIRISESLYRSAKDLGINISQTCRDALKAEILKLIKKRRKK